VLTDEQIEWLDTQLVPGRLGRSELIRRILDRAIAVENAKQVKTYA
jgi:hypothetical protein